ncbi:hypothetical protein [Xanthobacter sp. ZOL 2024]
MPKVADRVLMFVPERWGEVDRFLNFYRHTYCFNIRDQRALSGVRAHFQKALRLISLAEKLKPNLQIDRDELEAQGFTAAANADEIATVIEAAILEMYSTLDCMVKVMRAVYGPSTSGFKESTRRVFQSPHSIQGAFPEPIKEAIASARWYFRLLYLRDELTHLSTGRVHSDAETGQVRYDHYGLKEGEKPLTIDDIFGWLAATVSDVNGLVGLVFHYLNETLSDREVFQLCGMVEGRMLHRYVSPIGALTFNSGRCGAWIWFEKPDLPTCPFRESCGAYLNKAPVPDDAPPSSLQPPT